MAAPDSAIIQASAVAIDGRAVAIRGQPGSGKSSLTLALIDRGAVLIGDDGVRLERANSRLFACPPPNIAGKLEIRNVGLVEFPTSSAPLALVLDLSPNAQRFREQAEPCALLGIEIPTIAFDPGSICPAQRAEWALRIHGLAISPDAGA
jgi:serine kinase of HPr protein (carbohydrate metabolism regulator)